MYSIRSSMQAYMVSDAKGRALYWHVNDAPLPVPANGQNLLAEYLADAREIFKSEVSILMSTDRPFTEKDEERLTIMLKLLIDARKTWQEEEASATAGIMPQQGA